MCLENVSVDFLANIMIIIRLDGSVWDISVEYSIIDTSNNIDIHKYLMIIMI